MNLLKKYRKFFAALATLALLNVGLAFQSPRPATAQTCPSERSDCTSGQEECKLCSGCICWECGRDCRVALQ